MPNTDIRKFLPQNYLAVTGKNIPAIIGAINATWDSLESLIAGCIDQLFIQTATGRFLVQLGEQEGFTMPQNSGLDIRAYRTLVPVMVANPKQVRQTIDELIQAFYTAEKTRASIVSANAGPFSLEDGDDLILETESGIVQISIVEGQVSDLGSVTAAEIAAIINSNQSTVVADQVVDRATALGYLRITSGTAGASSKIRVIGGKFQNILEFPKLIATEAATGTTWNITKTSQYTDLVTFTWDGLGTNPNVYLTQAGDILTIRGLVDGVDPWSLLNGSYELVDVGYDYFVIRNSAYNTLSSTLPQPDDNNLVFTSKDFVGLYDRDEFALTSETTDDTITLTVPAIPPLGRRFLSGSAHLHGAELQVIDFTRTTIKLQTALSGDRPVPDNNFLLRNNRFRLNFRHPYYRTTDVDGNLSQPTYTLDTGDESFAILPYTVPTAIGANAIEATVDSDEYIVNFPFRHGLEYTWGFTLSGATASANITAPDLNKEHQVSRVINNARAAFRIRNPDGTGKKYAGIAFGPVDVFQHSTQQANGSDFYMQFPSVIAASVFTPGMVFKFDPAGGTDVVGYLAAPLRYRLLTVVAVSGNIVDFQAGLGTAPNGLIIDDVTGKRSGSIGGGAVSYHLDKTSIHNLDYVFDGLLATMLGYTASSNPGYLGSYLYDPDGAAGEDVTVSKFLVHTTQTILRGDNFSALLVDEVMANGEEFPQTGTIVLDYGTDGFEGPIRYYAVVENPGANQILIDPAYRFKKAHALGASVQYIHQNQVYRPTQDGVDLPFYVTGTAQARNTMFALAELLVAAGIFVEQDILLPDLRYDDSAVVPFD